MTTTTATVANRPSAGSASPGLSAALRKRAIVVGVFFLITYSTAALFAIGYGILSLAISATVLVRRDVTS